MRIQTTVAMCDLCGWGGQYARPADFHRFGSLDLCYWCAQPNRPGTHRCGHHTMEVTATGWTCSCGASFQTPRDLALVLPLLAVWGLSTRMSVLAQVPDLVMATGNRHIER